MNVWSLLTIPKEQQGHTGNDGYQDSIPHFYSFDSTVANSSKISTGDIVAPRTAHQIIGLSVVEAVHRQPGTKERHRCPGCGSTKIAYRKTQERPWRCQICKHEFTHRTSETIEITKYRIEYHSRWKPFSPPIPVATFDDIYVTNAKQQSIRRLDLAKLTLLPAASPFFLGARPTEPRTP